MIMNRDDFLKKLTRAGHNGMIKIVTGIRCSGKSFLLFVLFREHLRQEGINDEQIVSLSLDDEDNAEYRDPGTLYEYLKSRIKDTKTPYDILIDEVPFAISKKEFKSGDTVRLYGVLNGLLRRRNVGVYATGSNSKLLSKDVLTEFRGRGDEIHLNPLSFAEFMPVCSGNKHGGRNEYMLYGGLPPAVLQPEAEGKRKLPDNLIRETYLRDVANRHRIRRRAEFEELTDVLASCIGSLTDPRKLADTFRSVKRTTLDKGTIKSCIDYLYDAFPIEPAQRYGIIGRSISTLPRNTLFRSRNQKRKAVFPADRRNTHNGEYDL